MSQLPSNATELERALEFATDEETDVPLRLLVNPDTCPEHILPWLAWAWSVDRWDNEWSVPTKRAAIRSAFEIHAR
ncbi:TPA: phage tail protein I, partial [Pseudomonas aeruginosa]|nr:phage tail protein I [Pseudomonas aeruginosa]